MKPVSTSFRKTIRAASGRADSRRRLIGAVMAAANRLGLGDDARRDVYQRITGQRSAANLNLAELGKILDDLNKGWKGPMGHRAHIGKIRALWWTLYWLGEVRCAEDGMDKALDAFVARQAKVAALRFVDVRRAPAIIEALKAIAARAGVRWPDNAAPEYDGDPRDAAMCDRHAVLDAIWSKIHARGDVHAISYVEYAAKALGLGINHHTWSARELDAAIRIVGKKLRRALGREAEDDQGERLPGGAEDA